MEWERDTTTDHFIHNFGKRTDKSHGFPSPSRSRPLPYLLLHRCAKSKSYLGEKVVSHKDGEKVVSPKDHAKKKGDVERRKHFELNHKRMISVMRKISLMCY